MAEEYRVPHRMSIGPEGALSFRWPYVGEKRFTEPFFEETIARCMGLPQNSRGALPVVTADELVTAAERVDAIEPTAFVCHVSRCGSTLLAQLLSLDDRCIVLSEVPVLDDILRLPFKQRTSASSPTPDDLFKAAVRLLGRRRSARERYLVLKFDSWHTMLFDSIRRCYPDVPAVLLYRSPREVIHSHQKRMGMQAVPFLIEPEVFGFDREQIADLRPIPYLVRVLERYFQQYLQILASDTIVRSFSYHAGVPSMVRQFAQHSGIELSDETITSMQARSARHSKYPDLLFSEGPVAESADASLLAVDQLYRQVDSFAAANLSLRA
jgi:hypothetical protein